MRNKKPKGRHDQFQDDGDALARSYLDDCRSIDRQCEADKQRLLEQYKAAFLALAERYRRDKLERKDGH